MIWSDDGSMLLSAYKDTTARLWDFKSGSCIRVFPHDDAVCKIILISVFFGIKTIISVF